eukprot:TRINITY_DN19006_c0_g1_i1.p1 TRINITY_DN19006_c0_g1~~TRINITY_DN19006_c0_g1_i1.p1  ORF type:complete len:749 (+),score=159.53 TRINITY_DN19006_c0_g1_i1:130-2376(+)
MAKSWRPFPLCLDVFFAWSFLPLFAFLVAASLRVLVELKYSVYPRGVAAILVVLGGWGVCASLALFTTLLFEVLDVFADGPKPAESAAWEPAGAGQFKHRAVQRRLLHLIKLHGYHPLSFFVAAVALAGCAWVAIPFSKYPAAGSAGGVLLLQAVAVGIAYRRAFLPDGRGRPLAKAHGLPLREQAVMCLSDSIWWNKMVDRVRDTAVVSCLVASTWLGCGIGCSGFAGFESFLVVSTTLAVLHLALWVGLHVTHTCHRPAVLLTYRVRGLIVALAVLVGLAVQFLHGRPFVSCFAGYSAIWALLIGALRAAAVYHVPPGSAPRSPRAEGGGRKREPSVRGARQRFASPPRGLVDTAADEVDRRLRQMAAELGLPNGCKARNPLADVLLCRPLRLLDPDGLGASQRRRRVHSHMCACVWLLVSFLLLGLLRPGGDAVPDVYTHSHLDNDTVSFRAELAGVTMSESTVVFESDENRTEPLTRDGLSFCKHYIAGLPIVDHAALAALAYLPDSERALFAAKLLPGWEARSPPRHVGDAPVGFFDLRRGNLSAVVVRGTRMVDFLDWAQDVDIWMEAAVLEFFATLLPGLGLWPRALVSEAIGLLAVLQRLIEHPDNDRGRTYYAPVEKYIAKLRAEGQREVIIVGHSLGGGLSQIIGARMGIPAVSMSGPGVVTLAHKLGVTRRDIDRYVTSVEPTNDLVPMIGSQGGSRLSVPCDEVALNCHMPHWVMCELINQCGHPQRRVSCRFRSG